MDLLVMDDAAAQYVWSVVLPAKLRKSWGDNSDSTSLLRICACQYGPCGHCAQLGNHDRCTTWHGFGGHPNYSPLTYLQSRHGGCLAPVWPRYGRPCRWICPCPECLARHDPITFRPVYLQDALFTTTQEVHRAARTSARRSSPAPRPPDLPGDDLLALLTTGT